MWSSFCLKLTYGGNHLYSLYIKVVIIIFAICMLRLYYNRGQSIGQSIAQPSAELYPIIQFDRSGFTKADILDSSEHAMQVLSKRTGTPSGDDIEDDVQDTDSPFDFMKYILDIGDRKTRRQLLALEALGLSSKSDFEVLSSLGDKNTIGFDKDPIMFSADYYKDLPRIIEYRSPDYSKLCLHLTFALDYRHRVVDASFCSRLTSLGRAIEEGREVPLLTVFTWWLDPVSDGEILSRKAMISNWNSFRPFVVPIVFTNHRMNMAFANGNGWPCFPVTETNQDGLPVFGPLSRVVTSQFVSTFYGYAKQITMFDSSLLETLMAVKDNYVPSEYTAASASEDYVLPNSKHAIVISGSSIKMPHITPDAFVYFDALYTYLRENSLQGPKVSVESSNYVFYRGVDFTNMPPLVVHDDFLFRYAVDFSVRQGYKVIDASRTLLALRTFRFNNTNEWGRRCSYSKQPEPSYNRRMATTWYNNNNTQTQGMTSQRPQLRSRFETRFDRDDNVCVFEANYVDRDLQ